MYRALLFRGAFITSNPVLPKHLVVGCFMNHLELLHGTCKQRSAIKTICPTRSGISTNHVLDYPILDITEGATD